MELTTKDIEIMDYLTNFQVATLSQLVTLFKATKRNIYRLEKMRHIVIDGDIVKVKDTKLPEVFIKGILGTMEILVKLYKEKEIEEFYQMDLPFIATGRKGNEFFYFLYIAEGEEKLQCKLIDHENRGNLVIILENKKQVIKLSEFNIDNKIVKIYFINE